MGEWDAVEAVRRVHMDWINLLLLFSTPVMEAAGSSEMFFFSRIGGDTFQNLSSLPSIKSLPLDPIKCQMKQIHCS